MYGKTEQIHEQTISNDCIKRYSPSLSISSSAHDGADGVFSGTSSFPLKILHRPFPSLLQLWPDPQSVASHAVCPRDRGPSVMHDVLFKVNGKQCGLIHTVEPL